MKSHTWWKTQQVQARTPMFDAFVVIQRGTTWKLVCRTLWAPQLFAYKIQIGGCAYWPHTIHVIYYKRCHRIFESNKSYTKVDKNDHSSTQFQGTAQKDIYFNCKKYVYFLWKLRCTVRDGIMSLEFWTTVMMYSSTILLGTENITTRKECVSRGPFAMHYIFVCAVNQKHNTR